MESLFPCSIEDKAEKLPPFYQYLDTKKKIWPKESHKPTHERITDINTGEDIETTPPPWKCQPRAKQTAPTSLKSHPLAKEITPPKDHPAVEPESAHVPKKLVLSTMVLLKDKTPICSTCERADRLDIANCGHLLCAKCLPLPSPSDIQDLKPLCRLCRIINKNRPETNNLLPRYVQTDCREETPPRAGRKASTALSPEISKMTINANGDLVLKPEFAHGDPVFRAADIPGSYMRAGPLSSSIALTELQQRIHDRAARIWTNNLTKFQTNWGLTKEKAKDTYELLATPAKACYKNVIAIPDRLCERLEKENRCIRSELEMVKLKLAETRLQLQENALVAKEGGMGFGVKMLWVSFLSLVYGMKIGEG